MHAIDESTGRAAVMVAGQAPWHKLGVNVAEAQTSAAAIQLAGLDWPVELVDLQTVEGTPIGDKFATVRRDTGAVLGVVGSRYTPLTNAGAFEFMDGVIGEGLARYETAGALFDGRKVWIMARLPGELRVKGTDDVTLPYALLTNAHDGTQAVNVFPTSVRVVCNNTLQAARGRDGARALKIRHTASMTGKLDDARRALGIVSKEMAELERQINALAAEQLTAYRAKEYFVSLLKRPYVSPSERVSDMDRLMGGRIGRKVKESRQEKADRQFINQLLYNFDYDQTNTMPGIRGTAWAAYNAVSEYADHQSNVRRTQGGTRLESRLNSIWFGSAAELKDRAFAAALKLAN